MARALNIPIPTEFDACSYDEQADYIEALLERMEARQGQEFDSDLIELAKRRLALYKADPSRTESADEVKARLLAKYG